MEDCAACAAASYVHMRKATNRKKLKIIIQKYVKTQDARSSTLSITGSLVGDVKLLNPSKNCSFQVLVRRKFEK